MDVLTFDLVAFVNGDQDYLGHDIDKLGVLEIEEVKNEQTFEDPKVSNGHCLVCGKQTETFRHYGGTSCNSCRAFFRRSVENEEKSKDKFKCKNEKENVTGTITRQRKNIRVH